MTHANGALRVLPRRPVIDTSGLLLRIVVTYGETITADEVLPVAQARAFFGWMARTYPKQAGAASTARVDADWSWYWGKPKALVPQLRPAFEAYYHATYTAQRREAF